MGRAWVFGDKISTDYIIPGRFNITSDPNELRKHTFQYARPEFADKVKPGDVVIGGKTFGCGSSREHAAIVLRECGVYLIAQSYGWIFRRNCINLGLVPMETAETLDVVDGDDVEVDMEKYLLKDISKGKTYSLKPLPSFILNIHGAGGLIEYLNKYGTYLK